MKKTYVVHFGAGALGRGLVVPMLYESNAQIILVDSNPRIISALKDRKSYKLHVSDDIENPIKIIPIEDIVSPIDQEEKLIAYLRQSDIVTTSVRKENLKHITSVLIKAWGDCDCRNKMIICCENVEGVGSYFKNLLVDAADKKAQENLKNIRIPDTIVDRICALNEDENVVVSECFHECSVDANIVSNTELKMITSIDHIKSHFYRKRYLLNTYADTIAFIGKNQHLSYLYEAAQNKEIEVMVKPYINLLTTLLKVKYHIDEDTSQQWFQRYKQRLSNENIPRELNTVARNLWDKLNVSERFVCPLLDLLKEGIDISTGLPVLHEIIFSQDDTKADVLAHLQTLWQGHKEGDILLQRCIKEWDL